MNLLYLPRLVLKTCTISYKLLYFLECTLTFFWYFYQFLIIMIYMSTVVFCTNVQKFFATILFLIKSKEGLEFHESQKTT